MAGMNNPIAICSHLDSDDGHHIWFTGRGKENYWVCRRCASQYPTTPESLQEVPDTHVEGFGAEEGICGRPEILTRTTQLKFIHEHVRLPSSNEVRWVDFQPNLNSDGEWIALTGSGEIWQIRSRDTDMRILTRLDGLPFSIDENTSLCMSPAMDYGAIYPTFGQQACVFRTHTGAITLQFNRGDYYTDQFPYAIAFFLINDQTRVVVARDWNRLDVIDPATGSILTERKRNQPDYEFELYVNKETGQITSERGPPSPEYDEQRPEHDFNDFRGRLTVSPNHQQVLDNGFVWHPRGVVRAWNLRNWIERNAWESDETPALKYLAARDGHWHSPICWIDNTRVAIWGWGDDADHLIPAILIVDAQTGEELHWFAGPETRMEFPPKKAGNSMFFDKYLFCVHDDAGTGVWDVESGELLHQDPSLKPIHYHPNSKQFLSRTPEGIQLSRLKM